MPMAADGIEGGLLVMERLMGLHMDRLLMDVRLADIMRHQGTRHSTQCAMAVRPRITPPQQATRLPIAGRPIMGPLPIT